jgi:hypothetical protein
MLIRSFAAIYASVAAMAVSGLAQAAVTITISQDGANVVALATGTFDRSGLNPFATQTDTVNAVQANRGLIGFGTDGPMDMYTSTGTPFSLGSGTFTPVSSSTGSDLQIFGVDQVFDIDKRYVNNSVLSSSATWLNASFLSLGLLVGTHSTSVGSNLITVTVSPIASTAPEPATWAMMLVGFGAIGFGLRRRTITCPLSGLNP